MKSAWTKENAARKSRGVFISPPFSLARGAKIDLTFGQGRQFLVRHLLFVERLLQQCGGIPAAELSCPCDQAAVADDLIMLGGLRAVDQGRVGHLLVCDFARGLVGPVADVRD